MKLLYVQTTTSNLMETLLHGELDETCEEIQELEQNKMLLNGDELDYYNTLVNYRISLQHAVQDYEVASFGGERVN